MMQIICRNVEKRAVKMMEELHQMKRENDHCDFIVQVGDDVYYTHKNVLSAGSDYFKAMLKHDTKESHEGKVVFKDVDSKCLKNCIDFIYSGKFEIPDEKMNDLLHVAIMMQLEDVKQAVSDILEESITVENYFSTKNLADIYGLDAVCTRSKVFFDENIMEISNQPEFGTIEKSDILNLVKLEKSKLHEEEKLTLSLKWVEQNGTMEEHLQEFLEAIKFNKISPAFLERVMESTTIVSNDFGLYKLITRSVLKAWNKANEQIDNDDLIILFDDGTDCIRSFNPITEKVDKFHDEKLNYLKHFSTIALDSHIYVLCENKSVYRLSFRCESSKWQKMKDMICKHGRYPRSVSLSGSIFVIGGSYPKATNKVEIFTSSVNQWCQLANKPTAIRSPSLVSLNDSIYCIGGITQDRITVSSFCKFTPSSTEWVDLEPMRYPVVGSGVVSVDEKILVIGGFSGESIKNVECYDVTSAHWTSLSSMNAGHRQVSAYHIGSWIFAVADLESTNVIEKYDICKDKWMVEERKVDQCFKVYRSTFVKM